jgi:hypothetical protein
MADRQANINVNYNINTQSVQTAETTVRRAQQATDQFQKSVGQVGTTWQKTAGQMLSNGQRVATTIDGQRIQMQQLKAQIELTRAADTKRLQQLTADYKVVKASVDSFNKSLQDQQKQTQGLTQTFGGLITSVRAFLAAGLVKEVIETQLEMAKLAGRVEGVERAFARLPQSTELLDNLRKATHGAVSDLELMQQALRANNFEIDLKKLGGLLEFAATRAQQTGQEVDYLVNSIVMGIGMKSILRLDNLGLSATRLKEELGGVSVKAASVAEITRVVAKVAEESQKKLGGYFETSATKVDQLTVAWTNFKISLSSGFGGGGLATIFKDALDSASDLIRAFVESKGNASAFLYNLDKIYEKREVLSAAIKRSKAIQDSENGSLQERENFIQQEINTLEELIGKRNDEVKALKERQKVLGTNKAVVSEAIEMQKQNGKSIQDNLKALKEEKDRIDDQIESSLRNNSVQKETQRLLKERLLAIQMEIEGLKNTEKQLGIVEDLMDRIEAKEELIKTAKSIKEIQNLQDEVDDLNKQLDLVLGTFNDFAKLKLGQDKNSSLGITKLGLDVSKMEVKTASLNELTQRLNQQLKDNPPNVVVSPKGTFDWKSLFGDDFKNAMFDLGQNIEGELIKATLFAEVDAYDKRIDAAEAFYDRQRELAGELYEDQTEAEKKRDKELAAIEEQRIKTTDRLRKQQAEKEIKARRLSVVIDTAAGIARAFATSSNIYQAIIQAAIVTAYGASQLAIINKQKANFADGVIDLKGPGTSTSDSIPANLSRGESVMTAKETKSSFGILKAIRNNKLDDRVLEQIKSGKSGGSQINAFNDQGIIKAIKENKAPDIIEKHGILYKVYNQRGNYRRIQRSKSMGQ